MSLSNAALKRLVKLKQKKYREESRLFLVEGEKFIREATVPPVHLLSDDHAVKQLSTLTTPTGPTAVFSFLDVPVTELLEKRDLIVFLHGVQDPGNVGTIIRAAHAFGAGVALSTGTADLYNPKTVRATVGSVFHVPLAREIDYVSFLTEAETRDFVSVAAMARGGEHPSTLASEKRVILVGAEGGGLPEEVALACAKTVTIPLLAESLNAAVATSILLYEAYSRMLP